MLEPTLRFNKGFKFFLTNPADVLNTISAYVSLNKKEKPKTANRLSSLGMTIQDTIETCPLTFRFITLYKTCVRRTLCKKNTISLIGVAMHVCAWFKALFSLL